MTDHTDVPDVRDAFGRSRAQMAASLRAMSNGRRPVPGMTWSVADLAAHLVVTLQQLVLALGGQPCAYDGSTEAGTTAAVDERLLAAFAERDMGHLASMFEDESAKFASAVGALDASHPVPAIATHATSAAICAIFAVDHHNHGMQLARAGGPAWQLDVTDIRGCLATVAPALYDRRAAASMQRQLALHLRGAPPLGISVAHGALEVGTPSGRVDCHVVADPATFLELSAGGFVSRSHALVTGKLWAYGRRPWAAVALTKLLPPVDHGGKLRPRRRRSVIDLRDRYARPRAREAGRERTP